MRAFTTTLKQSDPRLPGELDPLDNPSPEDLPTDDEPPLHDWEIPDDIPETIV